MMKKVSKPLTTPFPAVTTARKFGNHSNAKGNPMRQRLAVLAVALLGIAVVPAQAATVGLYKFTGTITSVDDPFAAFSSLATVGAPVTGSFQYSTVADYPPGFQFIPSVTSYFNSRDFQPEVTNLELVINGVTQRSSPYSFTNLTVGDNVPDGALYSFPAGDFFRYFDQLPDQYGQPNPLVDYAQFDAADSFVVPFASLTLNDPTGAAFSSQDFPRGLLPLSAFSNRYGEFSFFDGNGEDIDYGSIRFRIDSIQSVPETGSIMLLACLSVCMMRLFGWGSLSEPESQKSIMRAQR